MRKEHFYRFFLSSSVDSSNGGHSPIVGLLAPFIFPARRDENPTIYSDIKRGKRQKLVSVSINELGSSK